MMQRENRPSDLDLRHAIEGGFKLWDYSPSLSRILLRATGRDIQRDCLFNVDLLLVGVRTIEVSTGTVNLLGMQELETHGSECVYEFSAGGRIVASHGIANINDLDPMETSIDHEQLEKIPVAVSALFDPK